MPEDSMIGFDFVAKDDGPKTLAEDIAAELIQQSLVQHARLKAQDTKQMRAEPEADLNWEDNVPPDMTDSFDFLL